MDGTESAPGRYGIRQRVSKDLFVQIIWSSLCAVAMMYFIILSIVWTEEYKRLMPAELALPTLLVYAYVNAYEFLIFPRALFIYFTWYSLMM